MDVPQQIQQAFSNLLSSKLRSFLAVLGILVGTASVVALLSSGELATQKALAQFKALGTDLLSITLYENKASTEQTPANTFSLDESYQLKQQLPAIRDIAPYTALFNPSTYQGKKINSSVLGVTQSLQHVIKIQIHTGRFISDLDQNERFCVIGDTIYHALLQTDKHNPIGRQIWIGTQIYTIIGIIQPWPESEFFNADVNQSIFIPIKGISQLSKYAKITDMILLLQQNADVDAVKQAITRFITFHAPDIKIFTRSAKELIKRMSNQHQIFTLLLAAIGGIALFVGGIGVMNVMLVSVAERRREIGIRKAIGARRRDIQLLFLFEAIILALFGGVLGIMSGIVVAIAIGYFANWGFSLFILPPLIGFIVSAATGIFFGFYPAYRAAQLNPIEALRYE